MIRSPGVTLGEIVQHLQVRLHPSVTLVGDADYRVQGLAPIADALSHQLTFFAQKKFAAALETTQAGAVLVKEALASSRVPNQIVVPDPYLAFAWASALFNDRKALAGVHPSAVVAESAQLGEGVSIGAQVVIEEGVVIGAHTEIGHGCVIGAGSRLGERGLLHPRVTVAHNCVIGDDVKILSGAVIGSDGFGYAPSAAGWVKIYQLGRVVIGNRVEIGANTCIDRGALADTLIQDGAIIDNLVHLAHNVEIGERTAIAACVGMAGSTQVGAGCTFGGFVAVGGHLEIAPNSHFNGATVVTGSVREPGVYSSAAPMSEVKTWRRNAVRMSQLDSWVDRIKQLEAAVFKAPSSPASTEAEI
jgi:UDP-3-O-[3-hydroxymyristoyl] glucosamine N-acyltransferase